jgi:hypothetical protein
MIASTTGIVVMIGIYDTSQHVRTYNTVYNQARRNRVYAVIFEVVITVAVDCYGIYRHPKYNQKHKMALWAHVSHETKN